MQTFLPHKVIVLLGERRRSNLAMVTPYRTLCTDHVLAEQINRIVNFDWLGEVVAPSGDLYCRLGICDVHGVPAWGTHNKDVTSNGFKGLVSSQPSPFWIQEPEDQSARSCNR